MEKRDILISFAFIALIAIFSSFSIAYSIEKFNKGNVIIAELENPAVYDFNISAGVGGSAELYSLVGMEFVPRGGFDVPAGMTSIEVKAYPAKKFRERPGNYILEYYLKGNDGSLKDTLEFKVVSLKDVLSIVPSNLAYNDEFLNVNITNIENTYLDELELTFASEFFTTTKKIFLKPYETISIQLPIDKNNAVKLTAGRYIMTAQIEMEKAKVKVEGIINYLEKQGTSISKSTEGFLVRKTTILKKNEGNVPVQDTISVSKDIISRLFSIYSQEPATTSREGIVTKYTWSKQLMPSESWQVSTTTNYTWPFLFLLLIIVVAFLVKFYTMTNVVLTKKVSYVKTKGGQFALKVSISLKAKKHVDHIQVIDRLPGTTKLYEKFGIRPDKIEHETRRLFWNIQRLQAGEERVISYIIYSDLKMVGRFELPSATAVYEREGKTHEILSNRAFFISETARSED